MLAKLFIKETQFRKLLTKTRHFFCNMPHFRQMARKLNITVPKLNQQILLPNQQLCTVYGVKQIDPTVIIHFNQQPIDKKQNKTKKTQYYDEETQSAFSIDKSQKLTIEFHFAKKIAQNLNLDICLIKYANSIPSLNNLNTSNNSTTQSTEQLTILSLSRFRQYVYREYYLKELRNKSRRKYIESQLTSQNLLDKSQWSPNTKGSFKNRIKTIRIGEDVHSNDLNYKKSQIDAWIGQGERIFKIISYNDSDKSYKALQKFCLMFEKEVEIVEEKIKNKEDLRKKPIIRYTATLEFDEEVEIDIQFINKRWRRRQAEIKLILQGKAKKASAFDVDFTKEDFALQKAYLAAFDQAGIPYPKQYDFLTSFDKEFQKQGIMSMVRQTVEELDKKIKQQKINPYEDEPMSEQQKRQRDKENRKIMGLRTMEDILEQMEQMKSREYEMEQYESERYKELQKQLTDMLKSARRYAERRSQG